MGAGANAGPREAPIPAERLWRLVEDPSASPVTRASAAAALTADIDGSGRERLRIAASDTASPMLKNVLDSAAAADEAALLAALDEIEPGEKRS